MQIKKISLIIYILGIAIANLTYGYILIDKGVYNVPAVINTAKNGIEAIFNLRTLSEVRVKLKGHKAKEINLKSPRGLLIKIKVEKKIKNYKGEAILLDYSELKGREIPVQVGNNLEPIKRE